MAKKNSMLKYFSEKTKSIFFDNRVWRFIKRPGVLTTYWQSSSTLKVAELVVNAPAKALSNVYQRNSTVFEHSLTFKLITLFANNICILMALFLAIAAMIPHNHWSNAYTVVASIGFLFLHIIKSAISKDERFNIKAIDIMLLVFVLAILIAALTSTFAVQSTIEFFKYHLPWVILVALIVSNIKERHELGTFITIFLVGIAVSGLYGIIQYIQGIPVDPSQVDLSVFEDPVGRVYSTMHNANSYAEVIILTLPLFFGMMLNSKNAKHKLLFGLMAVPPFVAFVLTQSRSGYIAIAVSAVVFLFFVNKRMIFLLALIGLASLPFLPKFLFERFMSIFTGGDSTISVRKSVFITALKIIKDFWLSGIGLGVTPFIHFSYEYKISLPLPHSHNLYLEVWLESGLVGIVSFMCLNFRLLKKSVLNIYNKIDTYTNNLLIAAISALAGILVFGLAEYVWFYPRVLLFYWVLVGVILSGLRVSQKSLVDEVLPRK